MATHHQHENRQSRLIVFFELAFDGVNGGPQFSLQAVILVEADQLLRRHHIRETRRVTIDNSTEGAGLPERILFRQRFGETFNIAEITDRGVHSFGVRRYLFVIRLLEEFGCDLAALQQAFGNLRCQQGQRAKLVGLALASGFDLQADEINCSDNRDTGHSKQQYL
ncbi:hypothetical protein [Bradyrhizobium sp.]|uniref:hypothetical protein n=1 Tax=Bradyrhizobium sp. TaxID=376 RepID=UPI003D0E6CD7